MFLRYDSASEVNRSFETQIGMTTIEISINKLIEAIARHPFVRAIGLSGGERPLPEPGEGDIDLFVYCTEIPDVSQRLDMLTALQDDLTQLRVGLVESGHWGQGDSLRLDGVETWLLYFTISEARAELDAILAGQYLERLDSYYYPIGRCAMWKTMRVFYDPDRVLRSFKKRLAEYPAALMTAVIDHHLEALRDAEDMERAVRRKDVFFYHFALDLALDHMLQALFALNQEYFPSRKRSETYLASFRIKPVDCARRLRQTIAWGGEAATLEQSYALWQDLVRELESLVTHRHRRFAGTSGPAIAAKSFPA
jgi:hypothetical protein